jgi:hypothetical protein
MTETRTPVAVLYVTGWCRSGSTLLGNLLGELPGVVHVGELHYLWRNGVLGLGTNTQCGCGEPVAACVLWRTVLARVAGDAPAAVAEEVLRCQRTLLRTRHTGARLAEATRHRPPAPGVTAAIDRMVDVYRAIQDTTAARLVVDSGKFPAEAAALVGRSDIDLRVLHLVRDPRASAHSWRKPKAYIPSMGVPRSTAYWTAFNAASDRVGRALPAGGYRRLRYEDFTARPHESMAALLAWCGLTADPPVARDGTATLGVNHTVTGNPDRLRRGPVRVRPDDAWRSALPNRHLAVATLLAAPLLRRYGYGRWR